MLETYIGPYWGSPLSNLTLNVRKSYINQVKYLHATFVSLSSRKKKHFSFDTFSRQTHLFPTKITSQSQPSRLARKLLKSNRGIRITFLSSPLFFFFLFCTHIEYEKLLEGVTKYQQFLGVFP